MNASPILHCCLMQEGTPQSGVSLAFTVLAMDAGPVVAQKVVDFSKYRDADEALQDLFGIGARCGSLM